MNAPLCVGTLLAFALVACSDSDPGCDDECPFGSCIDDVCVPASDASASDAGPADAGRSDVPMDASDGGPIDGALNDGGVEDAGFDSGVDPLPCSRELMEDLPADTHAYAVVPSVVRNDGSEEFVLEVTPNADGVTAVRLTGAAALVGGDREIYDDGMGADVLAGDGVYTAGPLQLVSPGPGVNGFYSYNTDSPFGVQTKTIGDVEITVEGEAEARGFLIRPEVGLVDPSLPIPAVTVLGSGARRADHFVELCRHDRATQRAIRFLGGAPDLAQQLYVDMPDDFHFIVAFSTIHVERTDERRPNFTAGVHFKVRNRIEGIGLGLSDSGERYGSDDTLLSVNVLDTMDRGQSSQNALHEILHQWGANIRTGGIADGHWAPRSNIGSLLGGFRWVEQGDGRFIRDCSVGRNQARRVSNLDAYTMGLIPSSSIDDIYVAPSEERVMCDAEPPPPYTTVTGADIVEEYGERTPSPEDSLRDYRLLFVAETAGRRLTDSERVFFEIFAEHFTKELPAGMPDPDVTNNGWATVSRFFGGEVRFRSDL